MKTDCSAPVSYTHLDVYKRQVLGRPNYQELMEGSLKFFKKGLRIGMYNNRLTARAYKISLDGSLGARSAWMLEDYEDLSLIHISGAVHDLSRWGKSGGLHSRTRLL